MKITKTNREEVVVLRPHARRIDASSVVEFKSKLKEEVADGHTKIVLDLSEVDFIDSSGLGVMVSFLKQVSPEGGIKLFGVKEGVKSILELTRLDRAFGIHLSERGAIESFNTRE
jgi:anti-sigma B factor antagonist